MNKSVKIISSILLALAAATLLTGCATSSNGMPYLTWGTKPPPRPTFKIDEWEEQQRAKRAQADKEDHDNYHEWLTTRNFESLKVGMTYVDALAAMGKHVLRDVTTSGGLAGEITTLTVFRPCLWSGDRDAFLLPIAYLSFTNGKLIHWTITPQGQEN